MFYLSFILTFLISTLCAFYNVHNILVQRYIYLFYKQTNKNILKVNNKKKI